MAAAITILFREDPGPEKVKALLTELQTLESVEGAGVETTRSVGAAEIAMWVGLTADAFGLVAAAAAVLGKIIDRVRSRGIRGAVIELPTGVRISLDSTSAEELLSLVSAWKSEEADWSRGKGGGA